jgi:hypothetical protein
MSQFNLNDEQTVDPSGIIKNARPAVTGGRTTLDMRSGGMTKAMQRVLLHERVEKAFVDAEGRKPNANDSDFWRLHAAIEKGQVTDADLLPTSDTGDASARSGPGYSSSPFDTNRGHPQDVPVEGGPLTGNGEPMEKIDYTAVPVSALRKLAIGGDAQAAGELHRRGLPSGSAPNVDADELHKAEPFAKAVHGRLEGTKALDHGNGWVSETNDDGLLRGFSNDPADAELTSIGADFLRTLMSERNR